MPIQTKPSTSSSKDERNQKSIEKLIIKAVSTINDALVIAIRPRPKTITSFIKGSESSPFYKRLFLKHDDICGAMKNITTDEVTAVIEYLVVQGQLIRQGSDLHVNQTISQIRHELDRIFENRDNAKAFNETELLSLCDWNGTHKKAEPVQSIMTNDGYLFHCDSLEEVSILKKLSKKMFYKHMRGQSFSIPYTRNTKKKRLYFPDIVMLTHDDRIAIIEVKQTRMMSYFEYILKYEAMKQYCIEKGYIYTMCDRTFTTFESLKTLKISASLKRQFEEILMTQGYFNNASFKTMSKTMNTKQKHHLQLHLTALVIQNNLKNKAKYGFDIKHNETLDQLNHLKA